MRSRRDFLASAAGAATFYALPAFGQSAATQVVGVSRRGVGAIKVTALLDGFIPLEPSTLTGSDPAQIAALMQSAFLSGTAVDTSVNTYVVETGDRTVLVDGGVVIGPDGAPAFGPTTGKTGAAFEAAGFNADQIDTVFCTHLHPDHIGFFLDGAEARFKNADLVVHEADHAFWTAAENFTGADEQTQSFAAAAQAVVAAYGDRVSLVKGGAAVAPGLEVMHLPGHTPGHSGLVASSGDQSLLIWGDIVHVGVAQFAQPGWTIGFDVDQPAAAATRKKLFDQVATDRLEIAGAHIDFPSFGHLVKAAEGYRFAPSRWDHQL
ncbi:MAG: MBL fold metallo-hydrolase [Pseudomonadota bacterium]